MGLKSEKDMEVKGSVFLSRSLLILKKIYWIWLGLCFVPWFILALPNKALSNLSDSFIRNLFFDSKFGSYLTYSSFLTPVIFIIISIVRRKVSVWEFSIVAATWCLIFYTFPHLRS